MPVILDRRAGREVSGKEKVRAPASAAARPAAKREMPLAGVPRKPLIAGAIVFGLVVVGGLWFLFGYGPEDSGAAAVAVESAPPRSLAAAPPATSSPTAVTTGAVSGQNTAPSMPGAGDTAVLAPGAAPPPAGSYPSSGSVGGWRQNQPLVHVDRAAGPGEYEGMPPSGSLDSNSGTWKPGLAFGAPVRGNASDP